MKILVGSSKTSSMIGLPGKMNWGMRTLSLFALAFGLIATGTLSLAIATDFWLYTSEHVALQPDYTDGLNMSLMLDEKISEKLVQVHAHSGLWRSCVYFPAEQMAEYAGDAFGEPVDPEPDGEYPDDAMMGYPYADGYPGLDGAPLEEPAPYCWVINYFQPWERQEGSDTTNSILRAVRKSTPVIVFSMMILIVALALSTIGNARRDVKTLIGAVLFIFGALCLAVGVIFYISAVNDEVSHRKKPEGSDSEGFKYSYGWAFFFAGASFMCAMVAAVSNITLYIKRYPNLEDMVLIIPGLEKKSNMDFAKDQEPEFDNGAQNPTIIL